MHVKDSKSKLAMNYTENNKGYMGEFGGKKLEDGRGVMM